MSQCGPPKVPKKQADQDVIFRNTGQLSASIFRSNWTISDLLTADNGVVCEVQVVGPRTIEVDPTLDYFA